MIAVMTPLLLAVIAATLLAILWHARRDRAHDLLDDHRTPDALFRERLTNRLQELLMPLSGFQDDLTGTTQAVNELSATTAAHAGHLRDLNEHLARLEAHITDLAVLVRQFAPCEACPIRRREP